ncbi:major facilitator superfamily transporter [Colletotrichum phormii]|uniref:Major facilitator superfamily transporter n=1 Tax=Colletotrichum phormii TaxID=359342 RepID=A0AAJ0EKB3_9PEZI|nr:major facilitator superfamily transporter [Colletotrichum phormii]KAK1654407.1 major facilitator superfamily transporter [Colletotrichum phormii]
MTATIHDPEKDFFPPEETKTKSPSRGEDQSSSQSSDSEDEITEVGRNGDRSRKSADADADADSERDGEVDGEGDPSAGDAPARTRSRASSTRSRALSIVARSKRRGFLARLTTIPEVDNPYNYTNKTKWTITLIIALAAAVSPMGSSIFYPALTEMSKEFGVTPTITNLSVAFYMLAMAIFPLWWSSFSETLGRRTIYLLSFTLFVLFSILSAVSVNIEMLIVMRLLAGGASASVQAVGAGTIADIWEPRERGRAMSIFYLGPLTGPLLAPIIGGALAQRFGWQSTMWTLAIYGGLVLVMILFCLPETLARPKPAAVVVSQPQGASEGGGEKIALSRTKTTESVQVHSKKAAAFFKKSFIDPLSVLLYLRFPPVAITVWFAAVTFGALFVVNISVQATLSQAPYGFSELIIGLFYFPAGLGYFLASLLGGRWLDVIMAREARKAGRYDADGKLILLPEDRMRENIWIAATVYPASLIYYGWVVEKGLFWFVPCIGLFTFGASSMLVFGAATTMLTEFMPKRSSGGVAVNNFVRNIFSCIGAIAAQPVINAIGNGWLFTILGIFAWVSGYICVWTLRKKAPEWRKSMDAALNQ